ncbi:MAG TPA: T6SS amidase immunity protein Tai4 family protein [Polyangia bacterium]|nr:T6SS amidase immunity protein Tai4 family protein [Polyangia bacterium]
MALTALLWALPVNHANLERPASEADLLRAFAFARCLEKAYEKTPFGEDAQRVANAYVELGNINRAEVYDQISKVAGSLDAAKPTVVGRNNLAIMACLEFYESAKLKQLTRKSAARPMPGKK